MPADPIASVVAGPAPDLERTALDLYHPVLDRWCRVLTADQAAVLAESGWVPATAYPDVTTPALDPDPGDEPVNQEA